MRKTFLGIIAAAGVAVSGLAAHAQTPLTYLFPAPDFLPAFAPFQLALGKGYYSEEGLDVTFRIGQGGANVAAQVAVGNADIGGAMGDTPMIVRANGLPIRGVGLLGGGGMTHIAWRNDKEINSVEDLRGRPIAVIGFQDTAYYNLLAILAQHGISRSDVDIQALGAAGVIQATIAGTTHAISGVPEMMVGILDGGVDLTITPAREFFPAQAQALISSDRFVEENPEAVAGFVRATLRAIADIVEDPALAAQEYVVFVDRHAENVDQIERIMRFYVDSVYAEMAGLPRGAFNMDMLEEIMEFYLANDIMREAVSVAEAYTNQFTMAD